jgi:hypothetical protein
MRNKLITTLGTLAGLGLMSLTTTASAAALTCVTGNNAVTVDSSNACAPTPGQNDQQVNESTLVFQPGDLGPYPWTYLDKDNRSGDTVLDNENNQIAGAQENWFSGTTAAGNNLTGTFSIDVTSWLTLNYNTFMIYIKPGNDGVYFLLDGSPVNGILSGTYAITSAPGQTRPGNGLSHMSLYGRYTDDHQVPEPGSLALLGLGLAGLGMARRRRAG